MPPTFVWVVLGLLVAAWGLWSMRPGREAAPTSANTAINETVAGGTEAGMLAAQIEIESVSTTIAATVAADEPELELIAPVTSVASPMPPAEAGLDGPALVTVDGVQNGEPESYTIMAGDTMGNIAARFGMTLEELMTLNGIADPNLIVVGQVLALSTTISHAVPYQRILPDSEVVLSPAYKNFNTRSFITQNGGYLASFREEVEGEELSGPEIVERVSLRYSIGPRVLLAMLEYESGWVTQRQPTERDYPLGLEEPLRKGLFLQLSWAANRLNEGYYNQYAGRDREIRFKDGTRALLDEDTNPGTTAVQNVFAAGKEPEAWSEAVAGDGFLATYTKLFGDPWGFAVETLIPSDLEQPELRLPWSSGETWYYTGGPHGGWGDFSAWAALDFVPLDNTGCGDSSYWVRAAASGRVIRSENGEVVVDMDGDGFVGTGWTLFYMHMGSAGRVKVETQVDVGDPIGHPSCEGGFSDAAHLHLARRYNGQWMDAGGDVPFAIGGWQAQNGDATYNGYLVRGNERREACACRDDAFNGISAP